MASCPHCGRKLRMTDWRQECPGCGTNLNYYDSNRRLLDESEKAEIEHALFQPKIDRAKAAYAGSKWAILRIVFTLLPVGALFLPLLKSPGGESVNVIGVYGAISAVGFGAIFKGAIGSAMCLAAALLLVSAAMILVSIILITMSLGKHGKVRVLITYGFMPACAAGAVIAAAVGGRQPVDVFEGAPATTVPGVGAYLYAALFLLLFLYNVFLLKKGIPVKHTPCLIGGLPGEDYFRYVEEGMSHADIRRKMLVALAELQERQDRELEEEGEKAHERTV
ncbi:MAG: hypothetical protein IJK89_12365 [Clostridia bacterium]|nr:hypothetical protein [Clostridia bacterium]